MAAHRVARDEPAARAHHAHPDDRPGLHAARLQPRHRRRDRASARGQHLHPGARLHVRAPPDRGRGRARGTRRRGLEVLAVPLVRLNFDLITGFSVVPLQLFSLFGMMVAMTSVVLYIVVIVQRVVAGEASKASPRLGPRHPGVLPDRLRAVRPRPARRIRRPHLPAGARAARARPVRRRPRRRRPSRSDDPQRAPSSSPTTTSARAACGPAARHGVDVRSSSPTATIRTRTWFESVADVADARWPAGSLRTRSNARMWRIAALTRIHLFSSTTGACSRRHPGHGATRRAQHAWLAAARSIAAARR